MADTYRTDLSNQTIIWLMLCLVASLAALLLWFEFPSPGSPKGQSAAIAGSLLLLGPALFSIIKRGESTMNPTRWFVVHVVTALLGCFLIAIHVVAGNWLSPPGIILACLVFLILQGAFIRIVLTRGYSQLFARNTQDGGFSAGKRPNRDKLKRLIDRKTALLTGLDPDAQEALFSPALRHWLRHPLTSLKYQLIAEEEALLIGSRASAPFVVRWARRWHFFIAAVLFFGLLVHVTTVLLFAGYVAGSGDITWWHITDWGAPK